MERTIATIPLKSRNWQMKLVFSQRHILPKNLRHAVKQLSDGELLSRLGSRRRGFGISQANIRKALASDPSK
jgi:hypothetical protein